MKKYVIWVSATFFCIFAITLYFVATNTEKTRDLTHYQNILKEALISEDKKNSENTYQIQTYNSLQDQSLIPYIDKTKIILKKQINVNVIPKEKQNIYPAIEIFEFKNNVSVSTMYQYFENKIQYKIDTKNNRLLFINITGKNIQKLYDEILKKLQKLGEKFE